MIKTVNEKMDAEFITTVVAVGHMIEPELKP